MFTDFHLPPEEKELVRKIAARAEKEGLTKDVQSTEMDITACHKDVPLHLQELLDSDAADFGHDVLGIARFLDRKTGKLEGHFCPRFALPAADDEEE